ncbi:glycoside hydrolase family 47 protein [Gloeophyllum trabeum ATCC 11539]|uniref:alpha-1,2-Mannosidase n=1 Tax=Gloeophyllum trabeum (strain ATCC 11539 / FP-39264 / Madison 617) TaxID=670483 RepID=S7QLH3_GLOTA|nr:glycoside hydrolase family 47 protein [Gloeophyllum trabeum ATCC 11539]EPQ60212.1 glycoside hydrolase family 47 protein [Gloeophyllum trabeum ATCC 11539]
MADATLRKRNATKASQSAASSNDAEDVEVASATSVTTGRLAYLVFSIIVAGFLYMYPDVILQLSEQWLGSSYVESPLPGAGDPHAIDLSADIGKRDAVVEAFKHAWLAYERDAMGDDEYHPISHKGSNLTKAGGIGYTVADSIDTMLIMGLDDEYQRAKEWVATKLSFDRDANFNTFETTIRVLGGLLSAYHLSDDPVFLEKAVDLGDRILTTFDTPSGLPLTMVNLGRRVGVADPDYPGLVSTAEVATLQLEFRYLTLLTDDDIYWKKAEKVMAIIKAARMPPGLATIFMNYQEGRFVPAAIRLGSRGDSYYEYLLKQYLQTNRTEHVYREMYADTMDAIHGHLIKTSMNSHLTYTAELIPERNMNGELSWRLTPKQDHLVCFLGGSLMLGAVTTEALVDEVPIPPKSELLTSHGIRDWKTGAELIRTCMATHETATGLAPEIVHFRIPSDGVDSMLQGQAPQDWYIKGARPRQFPPLDARYILRPETVESLFLAFRVTGDRRYREWGWQIFQAIEKHCRIETGGYASVVNVDELPVRHEDKMETFLMSETLKYLYLLFADASVLPLSDYVFNTEAHPFPVFNPPIRTGFS